MANQLFQDYAYDSAGAAIVGATVNLYDRNTTTPVRATTTTDANGLWTISHATEGRFDTEVVNGSSKIRRKWDTRTQFDTLEVAALRVRNPAFTYDYDLVPAAITADRQLNWPLITDTDTLVALALAQTLTNKTLTAPAISQVVFPAAQVASTGANTLDDYEEGSWTPAVTFGGAAVGVTYGATNLGRYVKIGNHVFITGILILTSKGSSTGAAVMTGMPFTSRADNGTFTVASIRPETVSFANQAYGRIGTSATTIDLEEVTEAGAITTLDNTNFADASTVAVGLHYEVTA